jgi:hypothetical protein
MDEKTQILIGTAAAVVAGLGLASIVQGPTTDLASRVRDVQVLDDAVIGEGGRFLHYVGDDVTLFVSEDRPNDYRAELRVNGFDGNGADCTGSVYWDGILPDEKIFGLDTSISVGIDCDSMGENTGYSTSTDIDCPWKPGPLENCHWKEIGADTTILDQLRTDISGLSTSSEHLIYDGIQRLHGVR